jgi:hypothetical protein
LRIKDAYLENRDFIRGAQKQYSEDYPTTALVTGMMAGAPFMAVNPLKFGALPQATTKVQAAFNAAKLAGQAGATGAVFGGAYGAGTSEGEDASSVAGDTLKGAAVRRCSWCCCTTCFVRCCRTRQKCSH